MEKPVRLAELAERIEELLKQVEEGRTPRATEEGA